MSVYDLSSNSSSLATTSDPKLVYCFKQYLYSVRDFMLDGRKFIIKKYQQAGKNIKLIAKRIWNYSRIQNS